LSTEFIFYGNSGQFVTQSRTVSWWSHDPIAGLPEI